MSIELWILCRTRARLKFLHNFAWIFGFVVGSKIPDIIFHASVWLGAFANCCNFRRLKFGFRKIHKTCNFLSLDSLFSSLRKNPCGLKQRTYITTTRHKFQRKKRKKSLNPQKLFSICHRQKASWHLKNRAGIQRIGNVFNREAF